jgi:hypothetical protein
MPSKILPCTCAHAEQDRMYGAGKRVHNATTKPPRPPWRCTVCGKERAA